MKDRIKTIRKEARLTQTDFGEKIGVKGNTITNYETGLRTPSDAVILSICRAFNVREEWLREGIEPMRNPPEDEEAAYVSELLEDVGNPLYDLIKAIMKTYSEVTEKNKQVILAFAKELQENLRKEAGG